MRFPIVHPKELFNKKTLGQDAKAGLVLGVESVPDCMSSGVLAAVNPVAGVYAGIFGMAGAALFTSSMMMPVMPTGAMSIIIRDVGLGQYENPEGALATLGLLTGLFMVIAGAMRLGRVVRFVSQSVITGFIAAVGVNIILGQFQDITGYKAEGNRIWQTIMTLLHIGDWQWEPLVLGVGTAVLILILRNTRLGGLGYVVAIVAAWAAALWMTSRDMPNVVLVRDIADVSSGLPLPILPDLPSLFGLLLPALSLTFVGLVQGAGVSSSVENPDGSPTNASQDFIGQGAGNILAALFRGMPVGGSASATVLVGSVGGKSRQALFFTAMVMTILIVALSSFVGGVPLAGLAGLLLIVGSDTIPGPRVARVLKTGLVPTVSMALTFLATMLIPLQYAVLVGVGFSVLLFTIGEANRLTLKRIKVQGDQLIETDVPKTLGQNEVVLIQPYGTMFFASAETLVDQLPAIDENTSHSSVILRLRGEQSPSATLLGKLTKYADQLEAADCRLVVVTTSEELVENLRETNAIDEADETAYYLGTKVLGATVKKAYQDQEKWVNSGSAS